MGYLGDVPNEALCWFLSIVIHNKELWAKIAEHRGEHTAHRAGDELEWMAYSCSVYVCMYRE